MQFEAGMARSLQAAFTSWRKRMADREEKRVSSIGKRAALVDNRRWPEAKYINSHAVSMSYLSMAIKGLGFLVLTWTTVVLLGGFVSMLHKKDFWCLTFITLVQTAGIFDANMNEKLGYLDNFFSTMTRGVFSVIIEIGRNCFHALDCGNGSRPWFPMGYIILIIAYMLGIVLSALQALVLAAILCPLAIIYMLGILMSGGISLWRLVEHDYGGNSDEEANLAPAMDTLYYLAVIQSVIFCYRFLFNFVGKVLSEKAFQNASWSNVPPPDLQGVVRTYLNETRRGCEKDPSFVEGQNIIRQAVDMIGSNSPCNLITGVKMMYTAICNEERPLFGIQYMRSNVYSPLHSDDFTGQRMLMKHLVVSGASSGHILRRLLETLDSRSLYDGKTRYQAAVIVQSLAYDINLKEFPRGIQHISSLIGTFIQYSIDEEYKEYSRRRWKGNYYWERRPSKPVFDGIESRLDDARFLRELEKDYKELLLQGLCILEKLAADQDNCRVISDTPDLVSLIMAPITYDLLDHTTFDHGPWFEIVAVSMEVMDQLTGAMGETGSKLRREFSRSDQALSTLWKIIRCSGCNREYKINAIRILTQLYMDTTCSLLYREDFFWTLVDIFTTTEVYTTHNIRDFAGEALSILCFHGGINDATIVIHTGGGDRVIELLVNDYNDVRRQTAADILEHLCTHYTMDDGYLGRLKNAVLKVLGELLASQNGKHEENIENQYHPGAGENFYASSENNKPRIYATNFLSSLLSLCAMVYGRTFIGGLPPQFDPSCLPNKLKEILLVNSTGGHTVKSLLLCKAIGKLVISMMKHSGGSFVKQDLESLIDDLTNASRTMLDVDSSMVFSSASSGTTPWKLHRCTLVSLVKEAKELHARLPPRAADLQ